MEAGEAPGSSAKHGDRLNATIERARQRPVEPFKVAGYGQPRDRVGGRLGRIADARLRDLHRELAAVGPRIAEIDRELLDLALDLAAVAAQALGKPGDGLRRGR